MSEATNQKILPVQGSLNVPIEHHPTIRYMVYNGYYKVMSNIPKMGHLPTPAVFLVIFPLILGTWQGPEDRTARAHGLEGPSEAQHHFPVAHSMGTTMGQRSPDFPYGITFLNIWHSHKQILIYSDYILI